MKAKQFITISFAIFITFSCKAKLDVSQSTTDVSTDEVERLEASILTPSMIGIGSLNISLGSDTMEKVITFECDADACELVVVTDLCEIASIGENKLELTIQRPTGAEPCDVVVKYNAVGHTSESMTLKVDAAVEDAPVFSMTASQFFTGDFFRGIGVDDEMSVSVSVDATYVCSFDGGAYSPCAPTGGSVDVSAHQTGGQFCMKSSADTNNFGEPSCLELPAFTALTCDIEVASDKSFEDFSTLIATETTICFADGVSVIKEAASSFGNIDINKSGMSFIARVGDTATIHNKHLTSTMGLYTAAGIRVIGLTIDTSGYGIRYSPSTDFADIEIIDNTITTDSTGAARGTGIYIAEGTPDISGKIIGNRIYHGKGLRSRGIEANRLKDFIIEDNYIESQCPNNIGNDCYSFISYTTISGEVSFSNNTIKWIGSTSNGHGYGLQFGNGTHPIQNFAKFNNNIIAIKDGAVSNGAVQSHWNFTESKGNIVCALGTTVWSSTLVNSAGDLNTFWTEPTQTLLSLASDSCPAGI